MAQKSLQWLSLVALIWLQSINATNTNFPAYSSQLKQILSLSQVQLNNLAFALDAGKIFGFVAGIATLYLPLWLVLFIGSVLGFVGYGMQYLFITGYITSLSYAHVFFLTVLAGNSICWINTVCYVVAIHNFPSERQVAVGLTSSYQGLSAKVYSVIIDNLFSSLPSQGARAQFYLLFNSILPLMVSLGVASMCRVINIGSGSNMKVGFMVMFFITIGTGIYAIISSLGSMLTVVSPLKKMIGLLVFLLLPLSVPLAEKISEMIARVSERKIMHGLALKGSIEEGSSEALEWSMNGAKEEIGAKLILRRLDFWLYFFVYLFGATIGMVFLNNLGEIAESRGYSKTTDLVSLSSSFNFFGRLLPSILDYFFSRSKYMISRPFSLVALMGPMASAFFFLLNKSNLFLYISTVIIGVCTGGITSIAVSITTELFGTKNFGVNHNVLVANIPIGSLVFGYLAALVYRKGDQNGDGKCIGMECYRPTFILWGSLCFLGTFLALVLYVRVRKFYSQRLEEGFNLN